MKRPFREIDYLHNTYHDDIYEPRCGQCEQEWNEDYDGEMDNDDDLCSDCRRTNLMATFAKLPDLFRDTDVYKNSPHGIQITGMNDWFGVIWVFDTHAKFYASKGKLEFAPFTYVSREKTVIYIDIDPLNLPELDELECVYRNAIKELNKSTR